MRPLADATHEDERNHLSPVHTPCLHLTLPSFSTQAMAQDLVELLRINDWHEVHVIGLSMGGMVRAVSCVVRVCVECRIVCVLVALQVVPVNAEASQRGFCADRATHRLRRSSRSPTASNASRPSL